MNSYTTPEFWALLEQLPPHVRRQAREAYRRFVQDPYHPGLQFKRVSRTRPIYSARISRSYRAVGVRDGEDIVWFWAGPHPEYEQLLRRLR